MLDQIREPHEAGVEYLRFLDLCGKRRSRRPLTPYPPSSYIYRIWYQHSQIDPIGYAQCCIQVGAPGLEYMYMRPARDYRVFLNDMSEYQSLLTAYRQEFSRPAPDRYWGGNVSCVKFRDWED